MNCKFCQSPRTMKYGFKNDNQYYKCSDCYRKFSGTVSPEGMRFPTDIVGIAIDLFYNGFSSGKISRNLMDTKGIKVDPATVWRWVIKYSKKASGKISGAFLFTFTHT